MKDGVSSGSGWDGGKQRSREQKVGWGAAADAPQSVLLCLPGVRRVRAMDQLTR